MKINTILIIAIFTMTHLKSQTITFIDTTIKYKVINITEGNTVTEAMGQSVEMKSNNNSVVYVRNLSTSFNNLIIGSTIKSIKSKMENSMQTNEFDTDSKKPNSTEKQLQKLTNIEKINSYDANFNYIDTSNKKKKQNQSELLTQLGIDNNNLYIYNKNILNKVVKTGLIWSDTITKNDKTKGIEITTFNIIEISKNQIVIDYKTNESYEGTIEQMGRTMEVSGTKLTNGTYIIDEKSKIIKSNNYNTKVTSKINFNNMEMPVNSTIIGVVTVEKMQ